MVKIVEYFIISCRCSSTLLLVQCCSCGHTLPRNLSWILWLKTFWVRELKDSGSPEDQDLLSRKLPQFNQIPLSVSVALHRLCSDWIVQIESPLTDPQLLLSITDERSLSIRPAVVEPLGLSLPEAFSLLNILQA